MECGDTLHSIIYMYIDTDKDINMECATAWMMETLHNMYMWRHYMNHTSIWSVNLNGVWRHSTLCNIHMDANIDMDTECESTCSVF